MKRITFSSLLLLLGLAAASCGSENYSSNSPDMSLIPVKTGGKWGYIDRHGKWKIKRQFADAFPFFDGLALVQAGTVYGFIDTDGRYRINPQYDRVATDYMRQACGEGSAFTTVASDHAQYK